MTQCTAKSKRTGNQCQRPAMVGGSKCYHHGGASLRGIASPSFKSGRWSKAVPARLLERYQQAERDPELVAVNAEIALVDARLGDLLSRADTKESGASWAAMQKAYGDLRRSMTTKNKIGITAALATLDHIINDSATDFAIWAEIHAVIDQRRRLAETEQKRLVTAQQMIRTDQAMALAVALLDSIRRNVSDPAVLMAVQADFTRLMSIEDGNNGS